MSGVDNLIIPIDKGIVDSVRRLRAWHWKEFQDAQKKTDNAVAGGFARSGNYVQSFRSQATTHMSAVQLLNCFVDSTAEQDVARGY